MFLTKTTIETVFNGRCVLCEHWKGDRQKVFKEYGETENKEKYLRVNDTWCDCGTCSELKEQQDFCDISYSGCHELPEPYAVFGCILHKKIEFLHKN